MLSRVGAQSLIARTVQQAVGATHRPTVHLHGRLFLTQVVGGRYDDVEIDVRPLNSGPLRIADVHADLHGVYLAYHDVLLDNARRIVIDDSHESVTLRYPDLNSYLTAVGDRLTLASGQGRQLRLTGTVQVLGRSVSASADVKVSAANDAIDITPTQFETGNAGLDSLSRALLGQRFTLHISLQALPFGQHLTRIDTGRDGITVHADGSSVVISTGN